MRLSYEVGHVYEPDVQGCAICYLLVIVVVVIVVVGWLCGNGGLWWIDDEVAQGEAKAVCCSGHGDGPRPRPPTATALPATSWYLQQHTRTSGTRNTFGKSRAGSVWHGWKHLQCSFYTFNPMDPSRALLRKQPFRTLILNWICLRSNIRVTMSKKRNLSGMQYYLCYTKIHCLHTGSIKTTQKNI